jgi:hypothetical protein
MKEVYSTSNGWFNNNVIARHPNTNRFDLAI